MLVFQSAAGSVCTYMQGLNNHAPVPMSLITAGSVRIRMTAQRCIELRDCTYLICSKHVLKCGNGMYIRDKIV